MEFIITNEKDPNFLNLCNKLDNEYFEIHGPEALKYKEFNKITSPHVVVLAIDKEKAIGCGSYKKFELDNSIEIKRVFVDKKYRKQGIATKIIQMLEDIAIANDYVYSYLETGKTNHAAIKTYKKLGYYLIENFGFLKQDEICICMKKDLRRN